MEMDSTARMVEARQHQAGLRAEVENDRLARMTQTNNVGSSVRLARARLGEALASVWILFVCSWQSVRAGQAPGRC